MEFQRATLENCGSVSGVVVVIDVLRAFSTAAAAFSAGASVIALVGAVDDAFDLKKRWPDALIMGEVGGYQVPGFDLGNSPVALQALDLRGRRLIHRSTCGTQGAVRSRQADVLLAASFCNAGATAKYLRRLAPARVTFVPTGIGPDLHGDEDTACSDYLEALLRGDQPDPAGYLQRVAESPEGHIFSDPAIPAFPQADLEYCMQLDCFDQALRVHRQDGLLVLKAEEQKFEWRSMSKFGL